jgi:hypothetical protein
LSTFEVGSQEIFATRLASNLKHPDFCLLSS